MLNQSDQTIHPNLVGDKQMNAISRWITTATFSLVAMTWAGSATAGFLVTYEAPGVQNANQSALCADLGGGSASCTIGIENFDSRSLGLGNNFTTQFGIGGGPNFISGAYTNVEIRNADQYGGAGWAGRFPLAFAANPYEVLLTTNLASGINYFGYWLSALDAGNIVEFYSGANLVFTFNPENVIALIGSCPNAANPYCGNPNDLTQNPTEPYVFLNFFDQGSTFDRIRFYENDALKPGGGYESDNHTVGFATATSGTPIPEPASLMLLCLGLAGLKLSRRQR